MPPIDWSEILSMPNVKKLECGDGSSFVPKNLLESNCLLDRLLDESTKAAIRQGAAVVSKKSSKPDKGIVIGSLFREIGSRMEDDSGSEHYYRWIFVQGRIEELYELTHLGQGDIGSFSQYEYDQGLYQMKSIESVILISYINHLGVTGFQLEKYVSHFREKDAAYRPPQNLRAAGCPEEIDYVWPTLADDFETAPDYVSDHPVHLGACSSTRTVWGFRYKRGWRQVANRYMRSVCANWRDVEKFSAICEAYESER